MSSDSPKQSRRHPILVDGGGFVDKLNYRVPLNQNAKARLTPASTSLSIASLAALLMPEE